MGVCQAVAYALLFKTPPTQIVYRTASSDSLGFVGCHDIILSEKYIKNQISVIFAGNIAETVVFGKECVSDGAQSDIKEATRLAAMFIRRFGMGEMQSFVVPESADNDGKSNQNIEGTNFMIEHLLHECTKVSENLIAEHKEFLAVVMRKLFESKKISPTEFIEIAKPFVPDIKEIHAKEVISEDYYNKMLNFRISKDFE